jgi:hypothetical protein
MLYPLVSLTLLACGVSGPRADDDDDDIGGSVTGSTSGSGAGVASSSGDGGYGSGSGGDGRGGDGQGGSGEGGSGNGSGEGGSADPNCYTEPVFPQAAINDIVSSYGGWNYKDELIEAMTRRWPAGGYLLNEQKNDYYFGQFSDSYSWTGTVSWLDTLVHEETHLYNAHLANSQGQAHALYFRQDLIIYLPSEQGFPRSEILDDLAPVLQNSTYASTYLTGSQGQRAFNPLLDEATCYGNEVPGMAVFGEYYNGGVSLRDGSAALLNFIQIYLRVARTEFSSFYNYAKGQQAYVDAVRTIWLRTHFHYQQADQHPGLGINDAAYRAEAHKQANLDEIDMFIGEKVGDSNCVITQ